jgi:hypothetical protein
MEILIKNLQQGDKKSSGIIEMLRKYGVEYSVHQPVFEQCNVSGSLPPVSEIETAALLHEDKNSNNFKMSASDDFKAGVEWLKMKLLLGGNDL